MKRFMTAAVVMGGVLAAVPVFAQATAEPAKTHTHSKTHPAAKKQKTQSMAHPDVVKQQ